MFAAAGNTFLKIYDVRGKMIGTVVLQKASTATWQAPSAGIYLVKDRASFRTDQIIIK